MIKKIINADDFGVSEGVNNAVIKAFKGGVLNSTSVMVNMDYAVEAARLTAEQGQGLATGLHLNLTMGKAVSNPAKIPLLVDHEGNFNCGFVKLLLMSLLVKKELTEQVKTETLAQIQRAKEMGFTLAHIDSHRHIHIIPAIFKTVQQLAAENNIPRIRITNEDIRTTFKDNQDLSFLLDGGLVKYLLLRTLAFINKYPTKTYFYSVLYTGKLQKSRLQHITVDESKYDTLEVMIHPSITQIDIQGSDSVPDAYLVSHWRDEELSSLLDKQLWENN